MGLDLSWGTWVFFGVPLVLWILGAGAAFRKGRNSPFFAYIAGSDHRLSLSRLQAFLWTLTIFGAFAAAMAVHPKPTPAAVADVNTKAQAAAQATEAAKKALDQAGAPDKAQKEKDLADAQSAQKAAEARVKTFDWVNIPAALLALAGIAVGSGVFSSLIAASNGEDKTACVTSVTTVPVPDPAAAGSPPPTINTLLINGTDLGSKGKVRFGRVTATIRNWKSDGTQIQVDVPKNLESVGRDKKKFGPLVVDTANGKLAYELVGTPDNFTLGEATSYYEFVDLFRDDKSPDNLDLMKFQMFGWTVIAVLIYIYVFLTSLRPDLTELPVVPNGIVVLTGLSQTGYLAGKGVSNVNK